MLKNWDNQIELGQFRKNFTANYTDQIKNKPQDLLVNTSSGNCVVYIAGCGPSQEFDSQKHDADQPHD